MKFTISRAFQYSSRINKTLIMPAREITILLSLSLLIGLLAGLVSTLFHFSVENLFQARNELIHHFQNNPILSWLVPVTSTALMLMLALLLVRRFAPEAGGSGVQEIEGALEGTRQIHWQRLIPVKFIAGVLTIGGGMVMGREGPTIHMGGNIGHMISRLFETSRNNKIPW